MPLTYLSIQNFRNLTDTELFPSEGLNFFFGANGAGKTSILECVSVLGLGRSYRSRNHKLLVQYHQPNFSVFARGVGLARSDFQLGLVRGGHSTGNKTLLDGQRVTHSAELALHMPVQWIDAHSFALLEGGAGERRRLLDWMVFHVKHSYRDVWAGYQKCLKQRNSLLRHDKITYQDLRVWDTQLVAHAEAIGEMRREVLAGFTPELNRLLGDLPFVQRGDADVTYLPGWEEGNFQQQLEDKFGSDRKRGFTTVGPHKADLAFTFNRAPASAVFSRGQQKAVVCSMFIAQMTQMQEATGKPLILLLDDFTAELDQGAQQMIAAWVAKLGIQCFVTGIDRAALTAQWPEELKKTAKLFHVKHGAVTEEQLYNGDIND